MSSTIFNAINLKHSLPNLDTNFDITCSASTDIWDKSYNGGRSIHQFDAPLIYRSTTKGAFVSARVTVSSSMWKDRFDQGGLCIVVKAPDRTRWIKTGIEVEWGVPNVGSVVKDDWADWSVHHLSFVKSKVTIEITVQNDGDLWVHALGPDGQKAPLRQITWWSAVPEEAEVLVGPYAAKPAPNGEKEDLVVHFENLEIVI